MPYFGTFWCNVAQKACCKFQTCSGCEVTNLSDQLHRHKYCHVHAEDKNRTRKKTRWEMKTVMEKQTILRKEAQDVTRIVLVKRTVKKPVTGVVRRSRMVKKTEMRQKKQQQKKIVMVKRTIMRPQLKYVLQQVKRRAVRMVTEMTTT